ncbi:hypothetical protein ACFY7C_19560 [Streptomyces sp. NPDC012769]|uniref:hypothetical protein n=1 Tax=Streptomyces sp. NPDC012769 TaxID=3364848 RepID=UPI00368B46D8
MAISFVGSSSWESNVNGTSYTITKPTGTVSGDLMIAVVLVNLYPNSTTAINRPSGWSLQNEIFSAPNLEISVMHRVAGSSEPSSWTGSLGAARENRVTICATYRGTTFIGAKGTSTAGGATSLNTATINNTTTGNWRITIGAYASSTLNYTIGSNEVTQRRIGDTSNGPSGYTMAVQGGIWDSGGTIGTGNTNRNITRGAVWESAGTWIAILEPLDVTVTGTASATLPKLTMSASGSISYDATMAVTMPSMPTMTASGISTPPEGPLDVLVLPVMSVTAATAASGSLTVLAGPVVSVAAETRFFGVRVVTPERELEKRIIKPRLGAVD